MNDIKIGSVSTFPDVKCDKEQALKPLEEACEVFSAWQDYHIYIEHGMPIVANYQKEKLLNECADVIQAISNLIASLEVFDATELMKACEERNKERGRFGEIY